MRTQFTELFSIEHPIEHPIVQHFVGFAELSSAVSNAGGLVLITATTQPTSIALVMRDAEMDAAAWSCGIVAGLIRDVSSVQELISRIMADADALIRSRLSGLFAA